jgi:diguanylate cyclase (GGDEF)-like protein
VLSRPSRRLILPTRVGAAVLLAGLVLSVLASGWMAGVNRDRQRVFDADAAEAEAAIETRLAVYEEMLEGVRGLYRSDAAVTRSEFHRFVDVEATRHRWPGVDALGFARVLDVAALPAYEASVQVDTSVHVGGYPEFGVHPEPAGESVVVAEFVEPLLGNEAAMGFDLSSDPTRRAALAAARDTGLPVATAPLRLVNDASGSAGVLLVAPVFEGDAGELLDRRDNIVGYVIAAFQVEAMLRESLETLPLGVQVTDTGLDASGVPFVDTTTMAGRSATFEVAFGGRTWLVMVDDGSAEPPLGIPTPLAVLGVGLVLTVLVAIVIELLARSYRTAGEVAAAMEREVRLDPVTGLVNRTGIVEAVASQLGQVDERGRVAVVLVDIDLFKRVNDERGRQAGDDVLRAVGEAVQRSAGDDAVVGRLVGDQFAVVLVDRVASGERALALAHGLRRLIATIHEVGRTPIAVTAAVGLAYAREDDPERLLEDAAAALHEAKRAGGDRVELFDHRLRLRLERQMRVETDLRTAIRERQFELRYQPQANARTGEIVGFEVLIRWVHPELGLMGPQDFIPVAEQAGIVHHLDRFVIEEASCQQRIWRDTLGRAVEVGVNLSGVTLVRDTIVDVVRQTLTRYEMNPADLCIEVTETAVMDQPELAESRLNALRDLSVRIDLDDFGTGYSSLTHLQRLPLTGIKVDRSFVSGLITEPKDAAIVEAAIRLAQQLSLRTVAEGVEDVSQAGYLDALGCDLLQGYLVGRPVSAAEATAMLERGQGVPVGEYPVERA